MALGVTSRANREIYFLWTTQYGAHDMQALRMTPSAAVKLERVYFRPQL